MTPEKANDNNGFVVKGDVGLPHARSHEVASSAAFSGHQPKAPGFAGGYLLSVSMNVSGNIGDMIRDVG